MNTSTPFPQSSLNSQQAGLPLPFESQQLSEELPGVTEVLMNSLRINKKLHGEIVARQHSVRSEAHQVNVKLTSLYRDMEEVYTKTQHLYEETVRQNQKTRFMAEELLKPFRDELRGKVDETTLSLKMKMMLSEFDNLGHKISYDKQGRAAEEDDNHTFRFVRTQLLPLVSKLQQDIKEKTLQAQRQQEELTALHAKQEQMEKDLLKSRETIFEVKSTLIDEMAIKFSDQAWSYRLNNFYDAFIRTNINSIAHTINNNHKQIVTDINNLRSQASLNKNSLESKIGENRKKIEELRADLTKMNKSSTNHESLIIQLKKNLQESKVSLQKQLITLNSENSSREQISRLLEQSRTMQQQVEAITSQLHSELEKALQNNDKGLFIKVSKLQSDFKTMSQHVKLAQKQLQGEQHEIAFIKDLLSKKANFTDIIVHTQNKADKQDYQELRHLLQNNHTPAESNHNTDPEPDLDSCMITQEQPREECTPTPNRFRKRQSTSGRKNHQHSVSPFLPDSDRDDSVKRYMLGLKNGANYTRENLLKEKTRFMFLNQTERRQPKNARRGETFTENFI